MKTVIQDKDEHCQCQEECGQNEMDNMMPVETEVGIGKTPEIEKQKGSEQEHVAEGEVEHQAGMPVVRVVPSCVAKHPISHFERA
jgi:hypothetical protein